MVETVGVQAPPPTLNNHQQYAYGLAEIPA